MYTLHIPIPDKAVGLEVTLLKVLRDTAPKAWTEVVRQLKHQGRLDHLPLDAMRLPHALRNRLNAKGIRNIGGFSGRNLDELAEGQTKPRVTRLKAELAAWEIDLD